MTTKSWMDRLWKFGIVGSLAIGGAIAYSGNAITQMANSSSQCAKNSATTRNITTNSNQSNQISKAGITSTFKNLLQQHDVNTSENNSLMFQFTIPIAGLTSLRCPCSDQPCCKV